jgi:hypothetical protein
LKYAKVMRWMTAFAVALILWACRSPDGPEPPEPPLSRLPNVIGSYSLTDVNGGLPVTIFSDCSPAAGGWIVAHDQIAGSDCEHMVRMESTLVMNADSSFVMTLWEAHRCYGADTSCVTHERDIVGHFTWVVDTDSLGMSSNPGIVKGALMAWGGVAIVSRLAVIVHDHGETYVLNFSRFGDTHVPLPPPPGLPPS